MSHLYLVIAAPLSLVVFILATATSAVFSASEGVPLAARADCTAVSYPELKCEMTNSPGYSWA